jgi:hypothetical protein
MINKVNNNKNNNYNNNNNNNYYNKNYKNHYNRNNNYNPNYLNNNKLVYKIKLNRNNKIYILWMKMIKFQVLIIYSKDRSVKIRSAW